ncbi:hypothetical protein GZ77_07760 [Endozoicomonas montiporae]|uniref:Uncharacterized protein n=2 Tax=Endozoicomonas montiporae TaxID=1027273 RepID=A0A081N772_9GAMM|nr:hypothetical protein [Endozoicomonas montiporae]AMO55883.1 hypothetical protein EZMO1_1734 [Endozoicomonas montiporae CL-33]KEQ14295.1 hypothetical protein GZ77_07760 [Endozoicomonas montiporae]
MNQIPSAGASGLQQATATSVRQVEEVPVERYFFSRWMIKIVDAISSLFGFRSPFAHPEPLSDQRQLSERVPTALNQAEQIKIAASGNSASDKSIAKQKIAKQKIAKQKIAKQKTARHEHNPLKHEEIRLPEQKVSRSSVSRPSKKAARPKPLATESRNEQLRRKKQARKQRRLEEKRRQFSEQQNEPVNAVRPGPKSHKMQRLERKAAERAEQRAARDEVQGMMGIDYFTEAELEQQKQLKQRREAALAQHQEYLEFNRLGKLYDVFESDSIGETEPDVEVKTMDTRSLRIPLVDLPAYAAGSNDYQHRVAELYQRLSTEKDDKGLPLLESQEAFQIGFAPVLADPDVDLDEVVDAYVNFKRLQSIESLVEGARFPDAAFGLLFDRGELEADPLEFEDVIEGPADMEPGFLSVADNNQYYRIKQYKDIVSGLFEDIENDLTARERLLADLEPEVVISKADKLPDSGIGTGEQTPEGEELDATYAKSSETVSKAADKLQSMIQQNRQMGSVRRMMSGNAFRGRGH